MKRMAFLLAGLVAFAPAAQAEEAICVECIEVRVGPASVVRGPFPDELDAPFVAVALADGTFRGFSANGVTYAIEGKTLWDMGGPRRAVLEPGPEGSSSECGRWLTSTVRSGETLIGMVHQESICQYGAGGQTDKTMAIATSTDDGLTWTDLGNIISGKDEPRPGTTSGEGDCTMIGGGDGFLYAYCLRNADYQTIAARAPIDNPTQWSKFHNDAWTQPGLDGEATALGFIGIGTGYLAEHGLVAAVATDPWFEGVRLSLSADKVTFIDLDEPLLTIDGSDWDRPAPTDLIAYSSLLDPETGSSQIGDHFILSSVYVPPGKGFEDRYLVHREVQLQLHEEPLPVQVGTALTRWKHGTDYITSTGPLTGARQAYGRDAVVAYMLTREPESIPSFKFAECSRLVSGRLDQMIADAGTCASGGYTQERTAGWLFAGAQQGTVPVYRCVDDATRSRFASSAEDCEGLGRKEFLLGHGFAP